jgi:transcriptional regulator with XRE-family HTH domain
MTERSYGMAKTITLLGTRIQSRLKDIGQTQAWLAGKLELSDNAISKWKKGDGFPTYANLIAMSGLLRCKVGYLVGDYEDEAIAEVARLMETISEDGRRQVLAGVRAVVAALPKEIANQSKAA